MVFAQNKILSKITLNPYSKTRFYPSNSFPSLIDKSLCCYISTIRIHKTLTLEVIMNKDNVICLESYRKKIDRDKIEKKYKDLSKIGPIKNEESETIDLLIDSLTNMIKVYEEKLQTANKI